MKEFIENWGVLITFLGLIGIEISPIKVNPISWIFKKIGEIINKELIEKVDNIQKKVDELERANDFKEILDIKNTLSNYHALFQQNGLDENQFRRCFELENKYKYYQKKYPGEVNGHMEALFNSLHSNYK